MVYQCQENEDVIGLQNTLASNNTCYNAQIRRLSACTNKLYDISVANFPVEMKTKRL